MRFGYIAAAAALTFCAAFAQDSGVLVPTPPRTVQDALGSKLRINLKAPAPAISASPPAVRTCAVRLVEVPVKENIDNGIFLKVGTPTGDSFMIVQPATPECPQGSQP